MHPIPRNPLTKQHSIKIPCTHGGVPCLKDTDHHRTESQKVFARLNTGEKNKTQKDGCMHTKEQAADVAYLPVLVSACITCTLHTRQVRDHVFELENRTLETK